MKKFFTFVAATLVCGGMFAIDAPEVVPSTADFEAYRSEGANVLVGFYTEADVCNDLVFLGSYNMNAAGDGWETNPETLVRFEAMEGFENWYVTSVFDASEDIQGKPAQLKSDGTFAWEFQIGDDAIIVSGTASIAPGYDGEVNINGYGTDAPVVIASHKWKKDNTPCVAAIPHHYKVILDAPICADAEGNYFAPAIIGDFNSWAEGVVMKSREDFRYEYEFDDVEKHTFKFRAAGISDWSNQIRLYNEELDEWYDNGNLTLGEQEVIEIDYSAGRYTLCVEDEPEGIKAVEAKAAAQKVMENGRVVILRNNVRYNVLGAQE